MIPDGTHSKNKTTRRNNPILSASSHPTEQNYISVYSLLEELFATVFRSIKPDGTQALQKTPNSVGYQKNRRTHWAGTTPTRVLTVSTRAILKCYPLNFYSIVEAESLGSQTSQVLY